MRRARKPRPTGQMPFSCLWVLFAYKGEGDAHWHGAGFEQVVERQLAVIDIAAEGAGVIGGAHGLVDFGFGDGEHFVVGGAHGDVVQRDFRDAHHAFADLGKDDVDFVVAMRFQLDGGFHLRHFAHAVGQRSDVSLGNALGGFVFFRAACKAEHHDGQGSHHNSFNAFHKVEILICE